MIRSILSEFMLVFLCTNLFAQKKYDYNWFLATSFAPNDSTYGMSRIDFLNQPPLLSKVNNTTIDFWGTNVSWSNFQGNFKYFSNGCAVFNSNLDIMANGDSITPGFYHDSWCKYGYAVPQGAVLLPANDDSKQYLFHLRASEVTNSGYITHLYYSKIDLDSMGGLGKVVEKNVPLIIDSMCYGSFTAVKHANGKDWWLISPKNTSNGYFSILLDEDGPKLNGIQFIGTVQQPKDFGGQAAFSPDGRYYVRANGYSGIEVFEFNRCTGKLYNDKHITPPLPVEAFLGVAISPNSRFLYISSGGVLLQYDLESPDIANSHDTIGIYDGYKSWLPTIFYFMQLGPDGKIYMATGNGTNVMHVINDPDKKGVDCNFTQHSLKLPTYYSFSPPNFPNYRLGPASIGYCDSLALNTNNEYSHNDKLRIFPNPAISELSASLSNSMIKNVRIVNTLGKTVYFAQNYDYSMEVYIELSKIDQGIYFLQINDSNNSTYRAKFIKSGQ